MSHALPLPDSDALRRAALEASWRRGRTVARRRLWWRWAVWGFLRIGLPAAALVGAVWAWTLWLAPGAEAGPPALNDRRALDQARPAPPDGIGTTPPRPAHAPTVNVPSRPVAVAPAASAAATPGAVALRIDWAAPSTIPKNPKGEPRP